MRLVGRNHDRLLDVTAISVINFRSLTVLAVSLIVMPSSVISTSGHSVQCGHGLKKTRLCASLLKCVAGRRKRRAT
jgi:hypothetical protein